MKPVFFVLIFSLTLLHGASNELIFNCGKYTVDWRIQGLFITFDINLAKQTPKYVAIGLSDTELPAGADVLVAEINSDSGIATALDYHVDVYGNIRKDDGLASFSTSCQFDDDSNYCGILRITRRLDTSDLQDLPIVLDGKYFVILLDIIGDDFPTSLSEIGYEMQEICFGDFEQCGGTTFGPIIPTTCATEESTSTLSTMLPGDNELELNDGKYNISWNIHDQFLSFEIESETKGPFVAVGISSNELMIGADLLVVEVVGISEVIIGDYHVASNGITIVPDPNQASGTLLEITDSGTKVKITRRLTTNDPEDVEILTNATYFLAWFEIDANSFPNNLNELKYGLHEVCFGNIYECNRQTLPPPSTTQITTSTPGDGKLEFNGGKYRISWTISGVFFIFEIESQTSGSYVAVGISESAGTVAGGDIWTAEFDEGAVVSAGDYHIGFDAAKIVSDSRNDVIASMIEVTETWKKVTLTRRLAVTGSEDIPIMRIKKYNLIWFEIETSSFPANLNDPGVKYGTHEVCFGTDDECMNS